MKLRFSRYLTSLAAIFATSLTLAAQVPATEVSTYELSLEQSLEQPVIPKKHQKLVKETSDQLRSNLQNAGFTVNRLRQGQALQIVIGCHQLFAPNDTLLSDAGRGLLKKMQVLNQYASTYKLLIAVHSDNTGEEAYSDILTSSRANAIDDFLSAIHGLQNMIIVPYGIGRDEPLADNDTAANRKRNRRVEFYLVPLETLYSKK